MNRYSVRSPIQLHANVLAPKASGSFEGYSLTQAGYRLYTSRLRPKQAASPPLVPLFWRETGVQSPPELGGLGS
jgi:hypothetical protein